MQTSIKKVLEFVAVRSPVRTKLYPKNREASNVCLLLRKGSLAWPSLQHLAKMGFRIHVDGQYEALATELIAEGVQGWHLDRAAS